MTPNPGYLITRQYTPRRDDWDDYTWFCSRRGVPRISVTKATYWKVEIDAGTTPAGRFDPDTLAWLADTARTFLNGSPSKVPRVKAIPGRVIVYGLSRDDARRCARMMVDRFSPLSEYAQAARIATPPKPTTPRHSLPDQVRGTASQKVVDLATERRRRRDSFGNPIDRGPA